METYRASISLKDFIKSTEGFLRGDTCIEGKYWIVGYGHTLTSKPKDPITYDEANRLLDLDLSMTETLLEVSQTGLTQKQVDAYCLLGFYSPALLNRYLDSGSLDTKRTIPDRVMKRVKELLGIEG